MSACGTSRHFAAKQQFGRYRGSSGHARRRFHIPSRNGVIVHRRPRRSKMALTRSVRPASKTRRFGRRVMRKCGSKNTSARMNRSRPRDRRTRDRLLRAARFRRNRVCCAKPTRAPPALWIRTKAGGAWPPAVAATGRTVGGLSEGRAGKQRDQRESSKKRFHHTSPVDGRTVRGSCNSGRPTARALQLLSFAFCRPCGVGFYSKAATTHPC
jgi:hypothetical protein